jgi:hypothetical protein
MYVTGCLGNQWTCDEAIDLVILRIGYNKEDRSLYFTLGLFGVGFSIEINFEEE